MADPNLPTVRPKNSPQSSESSTAEVIKGLGSSRMFMAGGIAAGTGAVGLFLLTQHIVISALLAIAGVIFLGSRQLIRKSLQLTANSDQLQLESVQGQLEQMKKQVSKCKFLENVEAEGTRAAGQADQLVQQYKSIKNILSQRFESSELTFARYLSGLEALCLSVGENLIHTKAILENLNLTNNKQSDQWKEQREQATKLLESTDQALVELAKLFSSINDITTKEKHRDQLDQSMQQIKKLADRAKIYSKH